MTQKTITGLVTWLKNWFYDKDTIDSMLISSVLPNMTQIDSFTNKGVTVTTYSDGAYVYITFTGNVASSGQSMPVQLSSTIPSAYRPYSSVMSPIHSSSNGYQLQIATTGEVKFWASTSSNTYVGTTVMYPLASRIGTSVVKNISLVSAKSIISYANSETTALTATYTEDGSGVSGKTVTFVVAHGSTTVATLTGTTNSSGVATATYTAHGSGDVTVTASCDGVSANVSIEDCWNTKLTETVLSDNNTIHHIGLETIHNVQSDDFCLIFDHKGNGNLSIGAKTQVTPPSTANYRLTLGTWDNKTYYAVRTNSSDETSGSSVDANTYNNYKITKEGSTVKFYYNDTLLGTKTVSWFSNYNSWSIYDTKWGNASNYLKNIRIKPL